MLWCSWLHLFLQLIYISMFYMWFFFQAAQQERTTFVSSLLPLVAEYSMQPPVLDAQSIVSNVKVSFKLLSNCVNEIILVESVLTQIQINLQENWDVVCILYLYWYDFFFNSNESVLVNPINTIIVRVTFNAIHRGRYPMLRYWKWSWAPYLSKKLVSAVMSLFYQIFESDDAL